MRQALSMITEKTGVPIGAVITILVFVVTTTIGATVWVTTVNMKMDKIDEIHGDVKNLTKDMTYVKSALGIAETARRSYDEELTEKYNRKYLKKSDRKALDPKTR